LTQFARVFKDKDCAARSFGDAQAIARHQQHRLLTVLIRINLFWQLLFHFGEPPSLGSEKIKIFSVMASTFSSLPQSKRY